MIEDNLIVNRDMSQYTILKSPEPIGWWQITPTVEGGWSTRFAVYAPLNPTHIKNTEELLGWKWIDGKAQEK
jgi:hypothetical protein